MGLKNNENSEGKTFKHYNHLEEVLNYILSLVPNDMKGEILEDWYKVLLKEVWGLAKQVVAMFSW